MRRRKIISRAIAAANCEGVFVDANTLEERKQEKYEPVGSDPEESECDSEPVYDSEK